MFARAHIIISGLVQGVGYRYFVLRRAEQLGVAGYAKNLFTGEVEVEAEGDRALVEQLIAQLRVGPRSAHVSDLKVEWTEPTGAHRRFEIR